MITLKMDDDTKINFDEWNWESYEHDSARDAVHGMWDAAEKAIATHMAKVITDQFRKDGIDVDLWNVTPTEGEPAHAELVITLPCFQTGSPGGDMLMLSVKLSDLVDDMIRDMPNDAREIIDDVRAILAKLEAIPVPPEDDQTVV